MPEPWQYQRSGDKHLLHRSQGREVLELSHYEIAQHTLHSGCSYRYEGGTIGGHELIDRINRTPVETIANIPLHLPSMHVRRSKGRSVD